MKKWSFYKNIAVKTTVLALTVAFLTPAVLLALPPKEAKAQLSSQCASKALSAVGITIADSAKQAALGVPVDTGDSKLKASQTADSVSNFFTDCVEKKLAYYAAKMILDQMTNSLVTWINGGFTGQPAFVTDPGQFFLNIGDNIAGQIIQGSDFAFLCSPFKLQVQLALALNYNYSNNYSEQASCTLSDVFNNVNNAFSDFANGGWPGWFAITQNSNNNPYGAFLNGSSHVGVSINGKQALEAAQLNWNGGFLNYETCRVGNGEPYYMFGGSLTGTVAGNNVSVNGPEANETCTVSTPGKTISAALDKQLGVATDELGVADDLDKIFYAIGDQLMKNVLGAVQNGTGLLGASAYTQQRQDNNQNGLEDAENEANDRANDIQNQINQDTTNQNTTTAAQNLALGKKVYSSGTTFDDSGTYEAENITDGNTKSSNGNNTFSGAITSTLPTDQDPTSYGYLMIDLGSTVKQINQVDVYERANPSDNDLNAVPSQKLHYTVQILDRNQNVVYTSEVHTVTFQGPIPVKIQTPVDGQYVRLQATTKGRFQIAEVKVFQNQQPVINLIGGSTVNVSYGGSIDQTQYGYTATDLEDGDLTSNVKTTVTQGNQTVAGVDSYKPGSYNVTYTVTDSQGGVGQASRIVVVQQSYSQ